MGCPQDGARQLPLPGPQRSRGASAWRRTGRVMPTWLLSLTEEELRKLREETNAETLRQELDRERQRRMELEQKVQEVLKAR